MDTYEYNDTIENREEQVEKLTEDIQNKKTDSIKDWLLEVSEESDIDSDVIDFVKVDSQMGEKKVVLIFDDLERANISTNDLLGCINDYCLKMDSRI